MNKRVPITRESLNYSGVPLLDTENFFRTIKECLQDRVLSMGYIHVDLSLNTPSLLIGTEGKSILTQGTIFKKPTTSKQNSKNSSCRSRSPF